MSAGAERRAQALAAAAAVPVQPTDAVELHSAGRVLILGPLPAALAAAARLAPVLACSVLAEDALVAATPPAGVALYFRQGRTLQVEGHLGAFRVVLGRGDAALDLGALLEPARPLFDLVLDLGAGAVCTQDWPPLGYRHAPDAAALDAALAELPELVGSFEKPRYFAYDAALCVHGPKGLGGCRRCIDACPAEAIISVGERVQVDPKLCQGGGVCASVCPSGAMRYRYPRPADALERLRRLLAAWLAAGDGRPVLLLYDARADQPDWNAWPDGVLPVELEEIGSAGLEFWLGAFAFGAARVCLARGAALPARVARALDEQLDLGRALLDGLGYPGDALAWVAAAAAPAAALTGPAMPPLPPATYAGFDDKRSMLWAAIDHLYAHAPQRAEVLALSAGAPFGRIAVDTQACTLCMACVSVCTPRALGDGGDTPKLTFIEGACVQCGLCERACPEHAISREPRLLVPFERRRVPVLLHEEPPFCCVVCGKPFATPAMIRTITAKLAHHPMFAGDGLRRLQMCDECRVKELFRGEGLGRAAPGRDA
ncbi:4Fe-4S binding protein [Plasticicumulans lactativorans]|uniref:4Fe-4S binding protein n=1 Tax=Plasticicumulans lactativorans TaxID=1133106 RepID=A0A4R2L577_9GAMM|nr:4Fe-4S binding protein [Plasticicumulans lactativorans]TCO80942.1 4Fe-4S binding protein [Plasticicumulans lactativorans]